MTLALPETVEDRQPSGIVLVRATVRWRGERKAWSAESGSWNKDVTMYWRGRYCRCRDTIACEAHEDDWPCEAFEVRV